jgi:hypothetical protein
MIQLEFSFSATLEIADCLGRKRAPEKVWPDGSYNCPFCYGAVMGEWKACRNPACFARGDTHPSFPVETAREALAAAEQQVLIKGERAAQLKFSRAYAEERTREDAEWRTEQIAEAKRRGACVSCLFQPGNRRVKFTKHRNGCPKTETVADRNGRKIERIIARMPKPIRDVFDR